MPLTLPRVQDPTTDRALQLVGQQLNPPVPQARVYNSANISILNNTVTALTFDSELFDEGDLHSTASNTGRLTAPITGLYSIGGNVIWAANATGSRYAAIRLNGATTIAEEAYQAPPAADNPRSNLATTYRMTAGDYAELLVFQSSGGALITLRSGPNPEFWMVRLAGFTADTLG